MKRLSKLSGLSMIDKLSLRAAQVAVVALIVMMLLITVEVILRKWFGTSTKIAHDFSGYLLVALFFWGIAETLRVGKHLRVTILFDRLKVKTQSILYKTSVILGIALVLLLLWASAGFVISSYKSGAVIGDIVEIPEFIPELLIPIGFFFFALQLVAHLIRVFRGEPLKNE